MHHTVAQFIGKYGQRSDILSRFETVAGAEVTATRHGAPLAASGIRHQLLPGSDTVAKATRLSLNDDLVAQRLFNYGDALDRFG